MGNHCPAEVNPADATTLGTHLPERKCNCRIPQEFLQRFAGLSPLNGLVCGSEASTWFLSDTSCLVLSASPLPAAPGRTTSPDKPPSSRPRRFHLQRARLVEPVKVPFLGKRVLADVTKGASLLVQRV